MTIAGPGETMMTGFGGTALSVLIGTTAAVGTDFIGALSPVSSSQVTRRPSSCQI
jgi:hypothetical protein